MALIDGAWVIGYDRVNLHEIHSHLEGFIMNKKTCVVLSFVTLLGVGYYLRETKRIQEYIYVAECKSDLSALAIALGNYHEDHGQYPPLYTVNDTGKPMHSWRVLILEYTDPDYYESFKMSEPWNSEHNLAAARKSMPSVFHCDSDSTGDADSNASYLAVVGKTAVFRPNLAPSRLSFSLSDTEYTPIVCIVEEASSSKLWTDPSDYVTLDDLIGYEKWISRHRSHSSTLGPTVVAEDGTYWKVDDISSYNRVISSFPEEK